MSAPPTSSTTTPDAGARREPDHPGVQVLPVLGGPVGDREPVSGLTVWIALRRAHEGGVSNLAGRWLDSGHRVPGYVADALDELTSAGLLTLGEVDYESCGVRRVTVTDSGSARYVALCQIHAPRARAAVGTPRRWACSPYDPRSHLLAKRGPDQIWIQVAVCGRRLPWPVDTSAQPTERTCLTCEALATGPQFGNPPDSGRPPVEQLPPPIPAPAGRTPPGRSAPPPALTASRADTRNPTGGDSAAHPAAVSLVGHRAHSCQPLPPASVTPVVLPGSRTPGHCGGPAAPCGAPAPASTPPGN